jgi:hypothetical protein
VNLPLPVNSTLVLSSMKIGREISEPILTFTGQSITRVKAPWDAAVSSELPLQET